MPGTTGSWRLQRRRKRSWSSLFAARNRDFIAIVVLDGRNGGPDDRALAGGQAPVPRVGDQAGARPIAVRSGPVLDEVVEHPGFAPFRLARFGPDPQPTARPN